MGTAYPGISPGTEVFGNFGMPNACALWSRRKRGVKYEYGMQHTIAREVWCSGVCLHSGARVTLRFCPAPPYHGVRFRRVDVAGHPVVEAHYHNVVNTQLATTLGTDGVTISTVEHLMAALYGLNIDNVLIDIDGPEVPIFDGSSGPFLTLLEEGGLRQQGVARQCLRIERPFVYRDKDAFIKVTPSDELQVSYTIEFPHKLVGTQRLSWRFSPGDFGRKIARARTFGFLKDVQKLQSMGLALGGSLENALVFDDYRVLNQGGFRYADECVRHKVLDFLGDLALMGMPMIGHFKAYKAGHALHNRFLKSLMVKPGFYSVCVPVSLPGTLFPSPTLPHFLNGMQPALKQL